MEKAGVSEEKMTQFILALEHDTIQEIKDHAAAKVLVDSLFDSEG